MNDNTKADQVLEALTNAMETLCTARSRMRRIALDLEDAQAMVDSRIRDVLSVMDAIAGKKP